MDDTDTTWWLSENSSIIIGCYLGNGSRTGTYHYIYFYERKYLEDATGFFRYGMSLDDSSISDYTNGLGRVTGLFVFANLELI